MHWKDVLASHEKLRKVCKEAGFALRDDQAHTMSGISPEGDHFLYYRLADDDERSPDLLETVASMP